MIEILTAIYTTGFLLTIFNDLVIDLTTKDGFQSVFSWLLDMIISAIFWPIVIIFNLSASIFLYSKGKYVFFLKQKRNKLYISGPITGHENTYMAHFAKAEALLNEYGYQCINPTTLEHDHDKSYESFMREDLIELLAQCDRIIYLEGHETSKGARDERTVSNASGIKEIRINGFHAELRSR